MTIGYTMITFKAVTFSTLLALPNYSVTNITNTTAP